MATIGEISKDCNIPPKQEGLINTLLPEEMLRHIFSYLDKRDLQQASSVNCLWNRTSIDAAKYTELSKIKSFAKFLATNLPEDLYPNQREQLLAIGKNAMLLDPSSLIQVRSSIHEMKDPFAVILKELSEAHLDSLKILSKNQDKPSFFENIFDLVRIYRRLDEANQMTDLGDKEAALGDISRALARREHYSKAIETAMSISDDQDQDAAVITTFQILTQRINFDITIEIVNTIPNDAVKECALLEMRYNRKLCLG